MGRQITLQSGAASYHVPWFACWDEYKIRSVVGSCRTKTSEEVICVEVTAPFLSGQDDSN